MAIIAPTAPAVVAFPIHHVVPKFQINMLSIANTKNRILFFSRSAIANNGIYAKKIRNVKGETGQANTSSKPDKKLNIREELIKSKAIIDNFRSFISKSIYIDNKLYKLTLEL